MKICKRGNTFSEQEKGFGMIEVLISLLIFAISILAIDGILITSNQNMEEAVSVLNLQKNGMSTSAQSSVTAANISVGNTATSGVQTENVTVNITSPQAGSTQTCSSGVIGMVSSIVTSLVQMLFGSTQVPASSANPTSVTISVPMVSIQDPGNQNKNMAWWLS